MDLSVGQSVDRVYSGGSRIEVPCFQGGPVIGLWSMSKSPKLICFRQERAMSIESRAQELAVKQAVLSFNMFQQDFQHDFYVNFKLILFKFLM